MPKLGHLDSNFSKVNDKFEISTFKIGYMRNFVNIRKLKLAGPKCPAWSICAQNLKLVS